MYNKSMHLSIISWFREFGDGYKKEPPTTTIATNAGASSTST